MYEYANRVITCTNIEDNISLTFNEREFNPFLLVSADGIYDTKNNIFSQDNTFIDGTEYFGSVMQARNIVIVLKDIDNYDDNRDKIDRVFQSKKMGTLLVEDNKHKRAIDYYTESVTSTATVGSRLTTISLICPNPHFYDPVDNVLMIATLVPNFRFPHNFLEGGEEFSYQNPNMIGQIYNENAEEYTGMTIVITVLDVVSNPSVIKIETREKIKVGGEGNNLVMDVGDTLVITTQTGNKNVLFTRNGVTEEFNHYLTSDSVFFQLTRGLNSIGYDADSGKQNMMIRIYYRNRYARA